MRTAGELWEVHRREIKYTALERAPRCCPVSTHQLDTPDLTIEAVSSLSDWSHQGQGLSTPVLKSGRTLRDGFKLVT